MVVARVVLMGTAIAFAQPSFAHHSYGMFDRTTEKSLVGTIVKFEWTNPHSWIYIAVPGEHAALQTWAVEVGTPGQLVRSGWKRSTLSPGDKVELWISPMKDGSPGGHLNEVKAADGKMYYDVVFSKKAPPGLVGEGI